METEAREADWVVHSPETSMWSAGVCCRASSRDSRPSARLPPGGVRLRRGPKGRSQACLHAPGAGRKGRGAGLARGRRGWRGVGGGAASLSTCPRELRALGGLRARGRSG